MQPDIVGRYEVKWRLNKLGVLFDTLPLALQYVEENWPIEDPDASVTITFVVY